MKYNVHVYVIVRVKVLDIEATSQREAIKRVHDHLNLNDLLNNLARLQIANPPVQTACTELASIGASNLSGDTECSAV